MEKIDYYNSDLMNFICEEGVRITYQDKWMIITKDQNGYRFFVYQKQYRKHTVLLVDSYYLSTALHHMKRES